MSAIDTQIYDAEKYDLSGKDIHRITDGKCNIIEYEQLKNYNNINDVMGTNRAVIILYETKQNFGHWVCLFSNGNNNLEFFDSYGLSMDEELKINPNYNRSLNNGTISPHLTLLISMCRGCHVVSNKTQLQKYLHHTNTCGRWVAMRIKYRKLSLEKFIELFTKNKYYDGDFWISAMTLLI